MLNILYADCIYQRVKAFALCYWQFETMALRSVRANTKLDFVYTQGSPYSSLENSIYTSARPMPRPTEYVVFGSHRRMGRRQ